MSKLFLCDTWARKPEGTDEYLRNYWTNAERDLDGALTEHFHLLLHEDRYSDDAFCARLQRWQREMGADDTSVNSRHSPRITAPKTCCRESRPTRW